MLCFIVDKNELSVDMAVRVFTNSCLLLFDLIQLECDLLEPLFNLALSLGAFSCVYFVFIDIKNDIFSLERLRQIGDLRAFWIPTEY